MPTSLLSNMNKNYDFTVKLKANDTGSAVLVKHNECYYLLTAAHVYDKYPAKKAVVITDIDGKENEVIPTEMAISPTEEFDICVMKLPEDIAMTIVANVKCATFEGSGYPCEIDGFPSNAIDNKLRIENKCHISQESEVGNELYVKLDKERKDGMEMQYMESGFSGSGVFVDSNGKKYLVGIIHRVEEERNLFIGWKLQKINEVIKGEGWAEIPLIPIELCQHIINQYNKLIESTKFVLNRIKNKIVGKIQLARQEYKDKINSSLETGNIVIITGEAGIGKSALAKEVLTNDKYRSVAVLGDDLDESKESEILANWNITTRLPELFKSPIWGDGGKVLLVESAERMLNGNTDTAVLFLENLLKENHEVKIVFTIRRNSLDQFRLCLACNGIIVTDDYVIDIGLLSDGELMEVERDIPQIQPYCSTDKTRHILRNPFYLNTACSIATIANASTLKESEFKDRLCRQIISGKKPELVSQRIEVLIDVARRTSKIGMNLVKCEMTDAVKSLVDDDILVGQPEQGLLRPGHDILTDWGLYYYGARYYDPRVSLWISTDILEEKNYGNSSYAYTYNPITFIDPIGTDTINISYVNKKWKIDAPIIADGNDVFNVANGDKKETYEFSQGEHGKRVNLLNLEIGETKDSYTLGVYHISGEADNGTGFYVAPGGEPSTKNGSGRRIPDGTYPIINPTAGSQWIKPGVGGNVSKRGIRFHYGGTNPRSWTEGCFVLSSGYSVNGNTIHYNADESKTASRNFDNALGAIGHFSYRPKSRTYNREGATFNAPIKHTLILKSRKK